MAKNDKKSLFWPIFSRFLGQTLDLHDYSIYLDFSDLRTKIYAKRKDL